MPHGQLWSHLKLYHNKSSIEGLIKSESSGKSAKYMEDDEEIRTWKKWEQKNKVKPRENDMGSSKIQWDQNYKEQLTKKKKIFMVSGHFFNLGLTS